MSKKTHSVQLEAPSTELVNALVKIMSQLGDDELVDFHVRVREMREHEDVIALIEREFQRRELAPGLICIG